MIKELIEHHEDRIHHVVHMRSRHGVGFRCPEQIIERRLHKVRVYDLENANENDQESCDEEICAEINTCKSDKSKMPNIEDVDIDCVGLVQHNHNDIDDYENQQEIEGVRRSPGDCCERRPSSVGNGELKTC